MIVERKVPNGKENLIDKIAEEFSLSRRFSRILVARGIDSVKKADEFLNSESVDSLLDPFSTHGVKEAVDRITEARDNGETVVVYGDYDADGITATAIAVRCLRTFGIEPYAVVPERENGYGLSDGVLEWVLEEYCPDLIITVDCGISAADKIEELKDLGVDVIVTDHHELPDVLPDCIVVDCKIDDGLTYDGLCGAGVAYKLGRALVGDKADEFLDLVAIATVADSMPLCCENRVLVKAGLKKIASGRCSKVVKELLKTANVKDGISATTLAYALAPRINAAGRMGDAYSALCAFLSDDEFEIRVASAKLNSYNSERQGLCDALYKSARQKLADKSPLKKVNVLYDESWNTGLVGIVAAKLVEETHKPTVLFTYKNGLLHGSVRSVSGINIFEALKAVSEYTEEYGGHAQAAGVTVKLEKLEEFENALDAYVGKNADIENLVSYTEVDEILSQPFTLEFAKELEKLEPCGTANKKPLFAICDAKMNASPLKYGSPHLSIYNGYVELLYFGGADDLKRINSPIKKIITFEPNISTYNGRQSVKGYVRSLDTVAIDDEVTGDALFAIALDSAKNDDCDYGRLTKQETQLIVSKASEEVYGTLFAASKVSTVAKFSDLDKFPSCFYEPDPKSNVSTVCYGFKGGMPSGYTRLVYLDKPISVVAPKGDCEVLVNCDIEGFYSEDVDVDRKALATVYLALKRSGKKFASIKDAATCIDGASTRQVRFSVKVFAELGLIATENGRFFAVDSGKTELSASPTYRAVKRYIEGYKNV